MKEIFNTDLNLKAKVKLNDGSAMLVTDYAIAGKLCNKESKMAVWMLTK